MGVWILCDDAVKDVRDAVLAESAVEAPKRFFTGALTAGGG